MAIALKRDLPDDTPALPPPSAPARKTLDIHWSMRVMSLVSLGVLGVYSYVMFLCRRGGGQLNGDQDRQRVRLSALAFGLDLAISAYFSAATPFILKKGGLLFDRKNLPRPVFWFFAVTGFVPTASMTLTVVGGWKWRERIRARRGWRRFHVAVAILAYLSWWLACSPLFAMGLLGEKRTVELLKKSGWLSSK